MNRVPAGFGKEEKLWLDGCEFIAGVDEVGRGAWAGPVVAAAVVFPKNIKFPEELFDSKLLLPRQRENLSKLIYTYASSISLGTVGIATINKFGIGKATHKAFRVAIGGLSIVPDQILVDSFYVKQLNRANQEPVKYGDRVCASIAAASIVAKVYRDTLMRKLSRKFPVYGFGVNKGYGTKFHQEAIRKHNFCKVHRKSFNLSYLVT